MIWVYNVGWEAFGAGIKKGGFSSLLEIISQTIQEDLFCVRVKWSKKISMQLSSCLMAN